MKIAERHGLKVICDAAQAPGARYRDRYAGTLAHVGGYSQLSQARAHGEAASSSPTATTSRKRAAYRNHAEAVVATRAFPISHMWATTAHGEIECAIGIEQLKKLERFVSTAQRLAARLTAGLDGLEGLRTPVVSRLPHVYYVYPMVLDEKVTACGGAIAQALAAEGVEGLELHIRTAPPADVSAQDRLRLAGFPGPPI